MPKVKKAPADEAPAATKEGRRRQAAAKPTEAERDRMRKQAEEDGARAAADIVAADREAGLAPNAPRRGKKKPAAPVVMAEEPTPAKEGAAPAAPKPKGDDDPDSFVRWGLRPDVSVLPDGTENHKWTSSCGRYQVSRMGRPGPGDYCYFGAVYADADGNFSMGCETGNRHNKGGPKYYDTLVEALLAAEAHHCRATGREWCGSNREALLVRAGGLGAPKGPGRGGRPAKAPAAPKPGPSGTDGGKPAAPAAGAVSTKGRVYLMWREDPSIDPQAAFAAVGGAIKVESIKWYFGRWKAGKNLPKVAKAGG